MAKGLAGMHAVSYMTICQWIVDDWAQVSASTAGIKFAEYPSDDNSDNSGISGHIVAAIDINTTANEVYRHNFPETPLWNRTIEGISLDEFNKLHFDMILMSPPCQPFTRLRHLPRFILLENVKGFEKSSARQYFVEMLRKCGYTYQEVMLSPTSIGIPNSRLRYFLMAKISGGTRLSKIKEHDMSMVPAETESSEAPSLSCPQQPVSSMIRQGKKDGVCVLYKLETANDALKKINQNNDSSVKQIQDFLEPQENLEMEQYLVPSKILMRYALILDIVQPNCRRSICFTKGYGRYVEGTGSVLQSCLETEIETVFKNLDRFSQEEKLQQLQRLKLRYFTPREVANIMGFPESFSFPEEISIKQRYKILGNSLNVLVVSTLLRQLIFNC
ncbi:tRNA (cytosine(38)-C(5))-methyltransferase isoform X2 [Stigmatopora nigra]